MFVLKGIDYQIRSIKQSEFPQLIELIELHSSFEGATIDFKDGLKALKRDLFDKPIGLICWVVVHDKQLIGYASFIKQYSTWNASWYLYLDCLFLKEAFRGKGIGKSLFEDIARYGRQENYQHIEWQTPSDNYPAIQFYNQLGGNGKTKMRYEYKVI